jgi:signal peptidase II
LPKKILRLLLVTLCTAAIDQLSTAWALHRLSKGSIHIIGPIALQLSYNTGVAFSLGQNLGWLIGLIVVVIVVLGVYLLRHATRGWTLFGGGLVLGGAFGNLADRLFRSQKAVVDFIKVGIWPIFNLADASIVVGVVVLAFFYIRESKVSSPASTESSQDETKTAEPESNESLR